MFGNVGYTRGIVMAM